MPRKRKSSQSDAQTPASSILNEFVREFPRREARVFTDKFVTDLARQYEIASSEIPQLKTNLEGWADVYLEHKHFDDRPRPGEIVSEIRNLGDRLDAFREALENLSDDAAQIFWIPDGFVGHMPFGDENFYTSEFGHSILLIPHEKGGKAIIRIERDDHFESLAILRNYCDAAIKRLLSRDDRGGRKRSEGLRMWAVNVIGYWERKEGGLDRKFTLTCIPGTSEPKSPGARFCVDAFRPLDPAITPAQHVTAIRHALKTRVKGR